MGCGCCKLGAEQPTKIGEADTPQKRKSKAPSKQEQEEEASKLEILVSAEENEDISHSAKTLAERVKCLRDLVDRKPATILAVNLAGDTLAQFELSVNATVRDLELSICHSAEIDPDAFKMQITYEGEMLAKERVKLHEVGMRPEKETLVTAVKSAKPPKPVRNPRLDRALFEEAWMGGGNAPRLRSLLEQRADPNGFVYSDGDMALHVTAGRGHLECMRLLLEAGADMNVRGVGGMTPMQRCSQASTTYWKGHYPAAQKLLRDHQASLNSA